MTEAAQEHDTAGSEPEKQITYAELKTFLDKMTPDQLAQPVVWCGEDHGGKVREIFTHDEDWVGDSSDHETWVPRSDVGKAVDADDYEDAEVCIPAGTVYLMVD